MAEEQKEAPPPKGKGKLVAMIVAAMLLVAGVAGGAAWYVASGDAKSESAAATPAPGDGEGKRKVTRKPGDPRIFVPMDQFVVNLSDADLDRYAQVGVVLEVDDAPTESHIKAAMPAVRNAVLLLISARSAEDLLTLQGKEQLAIDIALATHAVLVGEPTAAAMSRTLVGEGAQPVRRTFDDVDTGPVAAVHFSQFIVQ
jgi:flagellar FliL protein